MKNRATNILLAAMMVFVAAGSAGAQNLDLAQVLHGGPTCNHVINLMLRHGVNNDRNLAARSMVQPSPFGPMIVPAAELGDLELMGVSQWEVVDPACGPKFAVTVRNNSTRDVCGFRITLVGLLGRILPHAPTAIMKVDKVCAGEALEVQMTLPIEALAMGNRNGQVIGFQKLVVAIDSYDQFVEANEANNIKVLARTAIPLAKVVEQIVETAAVATEAATVAPAVAPATAAPAALTAPAATATPVAPATNSAGNELQTAINQLSAQQPQEQQPQEQQPAEAVQESSDLTL